MNKALFLSAILSCTLIARENPFFSTAESATMPISSNQVTHQPPLTTMTYNFPDQARVLKEATFTFQNVDGSLERHKLQIDQSIDWHKPLILSQYSTDKSTGAAASGIGESPSVDSGFIEFKPSGNQISLTTKYPILRSFSLSDPSSIIVDFSHATPFSPYEKTLESSPFTKVKVSSHGKFARATITLDGRYTCTVSKTLQGATVACK
ncbi:MAG: AMIN domain-containing protein [Sulfuricurvum sp.]|nr:AMIN domain-containing protein [Sulfuricurvum sp.]